MAQVLHPEMRQILEQFSVELIIMDGRLNQCLGSEVSIKADEFSTVNLMKKVFSSVKLLS